MNNQWISKVRLFENWYCLIVLNLFADDIMGIITKDDAFKLIAEQFPKGSLTSAILKEMFVQNLLQ